MSSDGYASLSPNNCGVLINLNSQITNFYVIVCGTYGGQIVKCFVGNYVIIPNAQNSVMFGELYDKMMKEPKKKSLTNELIILKNKFEEYMNYIYNFGINEIAKVDELENVKLCIMKAFSFIFDFSSAEDDDNSKKILEKELMNMQTFYYNNFLNFVTNLYENSSAVDPNFSQKFVESSIKNKYIEELVVKYRNYHIKRFNNIISNYEFFIYENDEALEDVEEKANQKYEDDIEEIKKDYSEENRKRNDNPNIEILINICNSIRNGEDINNDLNQLDEIIRKYLFYIVWDYKGRPNNVHFDFGRVSFMNIEIDGKYFCSKEDKINCCQKIIQFLEKADDKNYI